MPVRLKHPRLVAILSTIALLLIALVLIWEWDWLRPMVEARASKAIGREVQIGHFDVDVSSRPWITADRIRIANPPDFTDGTPFAEVERVAVRLDLKPLLRGHTRLLEIEIDKPHGDLRASPSGDPNWRFEFPDRPPNPEGDLEIGQLTIRDGDVRIVEPRFKTDFRLLVRTDKPDGGGEARLLADISGKYAGEPISGRFVGGSILSLRDPQKPYPVDLNLVNGKTHVQMNGNLDRPLQFAGAKMSLTLKGDDMAALYPLTSIPLPPTAPYSVKGRLDYVQNKVRFLDFDGRLGSSDLAGDVVVTLGGDRPHVKMDLRSDKVLMADLAGFVGATPGLPGAPTEAPKQRVERAEEQAKATVLPDRPINLPRLRAADFDVHYRGKRIEGKAPLDNLEAKLKIDNGRVKLRPLRFGVGEGQIIANIDLDGTQKLVKTSADIDFRRVDLKRLMQATAFEGAGLIGGRAQIDSHGNSLKAMLGNGNGDLKLFMNGGNVSALMVDLIGLDLGRALLAVLKMPDRAKIRCLVSDFGLEKGVLKTRTMLVDTTEANIIGKGWINLRDETVDYELDSQPKKISVASLRGPIEIKGTLKDPAISPDMEDVVARGGAAVALGALLAPIAALIATLQLGLGEDNDCDTLIQNVRTAAGVPADAASPKKAAPAKARG